MFRPSKEPIDLSRAPLVDVLAHIDRELASGATVIEFLVLDPDEAKARYAGEQVDGFIHRPYRVWLDLAERRGLRMCTPRMASHPCIRLRLERLDPDARLQFTGDDSTERYGTASPFARISKLEDPGFVCDMADALARITLPPSPRILDLGVNTGDELALLVQLSPALREHATVVGIDHSASAIAEARRRFADQPRMQLHVADVANLAGLVLGGRFDLILSIGTLQSPGIDDRALLRDLVQNHLSPAGAVILGIPNCRYIDGETEYGARMKNFSQPELGLLVKDVAFYRKYLQQHHRQVFVTGKHYILVTAVANTST